MNRFLLKHLNLLFDDKIEYAKVMVEVMGYKNQWFRRLARFKKCFQESYLLIEQLKQVDPKSVELNPDCPIRFPKNIDEIPFQAMVSIHNLKSNSGDDLVENIASVISLACYTSNVRGDFTTGGYKYHSFKKRVLNSPFLDMMGLFNYIEKELVRSAEFWEQRFLDVNVADEDYDNAEGGRLRAFNIINTIKNTCNDFGVDEKGAWQMPYAFIQTNSLEKATRAYVQEKMRGIKEDRMRRQRRGG